MFVLVFHNSQVLTDGSAPLSVASQGLKMVPDVIPMCWTWVALVCPLRWSAWVPARGLDRLPSNPSTPFPFSTDVVLFDYVHPRLIMLSGSLSPYNPMMRFHPHQILARLGRLKLGRLHLNRREDSETDSNRFFDDSIMIISAVLEN
jgi:hypothetical protein